MLVLTTLAPLRSDRFRIRSPVPHRLRVIARTDQSVQVDTGARRSVSSVGASVSVLDDLGGWRRRRSTSSVVRISDRARRTHRSRFASPTSRRTSAVRCAPRLHCGPSPSVGDSRIDVLARVELLRARRRRASQITLLNRRRARHPERPVGTRRRGFVYLRLGRTRRWHVARSLQRLRVRARALDSARDVELPFEIYQESSGGDHWNSPVHRNREARVPLRFRGYRLRSGSDERTGDRASPDRRRARHGPARYRGRRAAVLAELSARDRRRRIGRSRSGLFPRQSADAHELQGGEQKTHDVVVAFGRGPGVRSAARVVPRSAVASIRRRSGAAAPAPCRS